MAFLGDFGRTLSRGSDLFAERGLNILRNPDAPLTREQERLRQARARGIEQARQSGGGRRQSTILTAPQQLPSLIGR